MRLEGKRVLITGAARGIGLEFARAYLAEGASVALADINASAVEEAAGALGAGAHAVTMDVTRQESIEAGVEAAVAAMGGIDILVNNAALFDAAPIEEITRESYDRLFSVNVAGTLFTLQAVARHMIARKRGHVVNICSVQSALARPGIAPYTATKGAVANLTKGMAADWARHGLNCNGIAPGYFDTPLNAALVADPAFNDWLCRRTPAGRWGRVEELVGAAIFLSSDAASFVNGTVVYVDGGITASL